MGIYERMKADVEELDRMVRNEEGLGRVPPRDGQIRRPAAPMREAAAAQGTGRGGVDARTPSPGALPTNAADVDTDSEAPKFDAVGDTSSDKAISEGVPANHAHDEDELLERCGW